MKLKKKYYTLVNKNSARGSKNTILSIAFACTFLSFYASVKFHANLHKKHKLTKPHSRTPQKNPLPDRLFP